MSVKLALTTTQREIDQFTQKYECDLEFVCMVGVNDGLATCHKEFVTHLTRCGIKYGLMTSDAADSTINVGKKLVGHSFT
jgi:magnesium-transporting ATPase (P-type)